MYNKVNQISGFILLVKFFQNMKVF